MHMGKHLVWEQVIRQDFPQVDIVLALGQCGFAADLLTWRYAMAFLSPTAHVVFRYGETPLWITDPGAIVRYVNDPLRYLQEVGKRLDEPFVSCLMTEISRRQRVGGFSGGRHRQMNSTGASAVVFCPEKDDEDRAYALDCVGCGRRVHVIEAFDLASHLSFFHWAGWQPWVAKGSGGQRGHASPVRTFAYTNTWLEQAGISLADFPDQDGQRCQPAQADQLQQASRPGKALFDLVKAPAEVEATDGEGGSL